MRAGFLRGRVAAAVAAGLAACVGAAAQPPLLPGPAFAAPVPCNVDPFADPAAEQRLHLLEAGCGGEGLSFALRTPRTQHFDTGPSRIELELDQRISRELFDGVTASARLGYAAAGDRSPEEVRTQRLLLAASGHWRVDDDLALDLQLGRDAGPAQRTRARLGGQWRPVSTQLLFAQWAVDDAEQRSAMLGWRWAVWRERAWLELSARQPGEGAALEPRVGLQVTGLLR